MHRRRWRNRPGASQGGDTGSNPVGTTIEPLCEPSRDAKGSSYVKSAIVLSRTKIARKKDAL